MFSYDWKLTFHLLILHIAQCMNNMCHHVLSILKLSVVSDITIISPILIAQDFFYTGLLSFNGFPSRIFFLKGPKKKKIVPLFYKNMKKEILFIVFNLFLIACISRKKFQQKVETAKQDISLKKKYLYGLTSLWLCEFLCLPIGQLVSIYLWKK